MKNIGHIVRTTVKGEKQEVEISTAVFEDIDEMIQALGVGDDESTKLFNLLQAALLTQGKNVQRASMRPANPVAAFNHSRNAAVESMLAGDIDEDECMSLIRAAKDELENASAPDVA